MQTYSVDFQVPDSAATATAYLCGVKTNLNTIGVNAAARNGICKSQKGNEVTSILKWAKDAGENLTWTLTSSVAPLKPELFFSKVAIQTWTISPQHKIMTSGCRKHSTAR